MLVSINLRASITAVGPIVSDIRADLGLSNAAVGLLTTLPVLAFAGASPWPGRCRGGSGSSARSAARSSSCSRGSSCG